MFHQKSNYISLRRLALLGLRIKHSQNNNRQSFCTNHRLIRDCLVAVINYKHKNNFATDSKNMVGLFGYTHYRYV